MNRITSTYAKHANNLADKVAIQTYNQKISYQEWNDRVCKTANWFNSLSRPNKTVGIFLPNGLPFLQLFAGAASAGWIAAPLDIKWRESELQKRLALSAPSVLITTKELYEKVKNIYSNVMIWEDCFEKMNRTAYPNYLETDGDLPFYLGFTSGSTGEPKAFIRSHGSWITSIDCNRVDFGIQETDHVLIPGSLFYSHFLYGVMSTLFLGGTVYLLEKFSAPQTLSIIQTQAISVVYLVPTMIEALLREEAIIDLPVKIISSGAKWDADSKRRMQEMFPRLSMYEFYGASELSFVTVLSHQQNQRKPESVGKPCHNVEIQIRKSNEEKASTNEIGKIYVRSKMIFMGYLDSARSTLQSIQSEAGWVTVDDMGYLDEEGYLYISGREKNMILYGGINIFPEEIESVLSLHPLVKHVAVVGLMDSYWGQIVAAVVQGDATKMELRQVCKTKLASYKVPRKWIFTDDMPLTTSGKIARAQVRDMLEKEVNQSLEKQ